MANTSDDSIVCEALGRISSAQKRWLTVVAGKKSPFNGFFGSLFKVNSPVLPPYGPLSGSALIYSRQIVCRNISENTLERFYHGRASHPRTSQIGQIVVEVSAR